MSTALTPALREQHEQDEAIIRENIRGAFAMAKAFKRIRESRSYLLTHATFEEYCRERWDMGRAYINLMIAGNEVVESLPPAVATVVATERVARAVAKVEPSVRVEVVERAVEKAKSEGREKITARDVEEATHPVRGHSFSREALEAGEKAAAESEQLWGLKDLWKRTNKRDRAAFLAWTTNQK